VARRTDGVELFLIVAKGGDRLSEKPGIGHASLPTTAMIASAM
jgi:hypothetical protein